MPPAEQLASRILLGPTLRAQPDRRLVRLVRDGYDGAFEEIVRRYRRQLDRFAASIVGCRSEDVTQDALSKALLALRGSEAEIELRPWLYRIVRNTALNDLRDSPPPAEQLAETLSGGAGTAAEVERREELAELIGRLRALPEPQRAAIVMRELEGLSHDEIAAALGVSGGAARQAIYRARAALRDGAGALLPLPLVRALLDHAADAAGGATVAAGAASAAGASAAGGALGGIGAGGALKVGAATVLVAGSVGAGIAVKDHADRQPEPAAAATRQAESSDRGQAGGLAPLAGNGGGRPALGGAVADRRGNGSGSGQGGGSGGSPGDRGGNPGPGHGTGADHVGQHGERGGRPRAAAGSRPRPPGRAP